MPTLPVFIENTPNKAQAKTSPREHGGKESHGYLPPISGYTIRINQFDFPGSEAQSLPAMRPKPAVKNITDRKQIERKKILIGRESLS